MHFGHSRSSVAGTSRRVQSNLRDLVDSTEDLLRATAAYSGSEVEAVRNRLQQHLESARDQLHHGEKQTVRQYRKLSRASEHYAHQRPWHVAGWAVGLGVLVGVCLMLEQGRRR